MEWTHFQVFQAIVDTGSLGEAAHLLGTSASTVSRQLKELEMNYGKSFCKRTSRGGIALTSEGKALYDLTLILKRNISGFTKFVSEDESSQVGMLRIMTTPTFNTYFLATIMDEFSVLYPQIKLTLLSNLQDGGEYEDLLSECDIAITSTLPVNADDLLCVPLCNYRAQIYASQSYVAKHGKPECIEDLDNHRIIDFVVPEPTKHANPTSFSWLRYAGREMENPRPAHILTTDPITYSQLIINGAGIGLLAQYNARSYDRLVEILEGAYDPKDLTQFQKFLVYHSFQKSNPRVLAFREFILKKVSISSLFT